MFRVKNFVRMKQRKAGDLNQRFEPPVEFYFKTFPELV